ncbi:hypothetical protein Q0590_00110 [Rhodocytophaga aerolata]|uniref:Uncharacterized protein n=1 Tax=Rhodocytophaga aerolata TaxID=455078 RepID=A0ABT8R1F9_9BACT|nr:hypothetical protein [Rhodocytophaga aerolata]MDO1444627.1 hypothetical protein [Rhodocytophaga aerolata]
MAINKTKFISLQKKASSSRKLLQKKQRNLQKTIAELATIERSLKQELSKGSGANRRTVNLLNANQKKLADKVTTIRSEVANTEADISRLIDELLLSTDPRDQITQLDDAYPVFLMPVRIEARFMTIKHIVRVSRDKTRRRTEASAFTVVGGRAVSQPLSFQVKDLFESRKALPVIDDAHELWVRIFPDDIAVHTHEEALTPSEIEAAKTFWVHIWYAGEDEALRIGAWRGLVSGRGPERAAWIAKQMEPTNSQDKPASTIDPDLDLPVDPIFPTLPVKESAWSQAPHSKVLPERFVVRLYTGGHFREVVGEPIPDSLQLSIDPQAAENEIESKDSGLTLAEKLRWMHDFEEAEKIGMGIRVPLLGSERFIGFDKILILGVKISANQEEGQALLEELINNHHYTHGGFSIVPQGTPTNNTEDAKSGYTAYNSDEEDLFDLELEDPLFTETSNDLDQTDGQRLADALGISYDVVQHIRHADRADIREAICMNRALWPTTLGYYLSQMMHPIFSTIDISRTRNHFNQYILGRGRIPAIRVDDQPYGILPVTAFTKWKYKDNTPNDVFLGNMFEKVLKNMESTWDSLVQQTKHAGSATTGANADDKFLSIMGLHASSVEFYQRFIAGPYFLWNLYNYSAIIKGVFVKPTAAPYATSLNFLQLFGDQNFDFIFPPRLFDVYYVNEHKYLNGPVIDTLPLSELRTIQALGSNEENYIDWLIQSNWEEIKAENFSNIGATGAPPPTALLYLMLRHAALLEYVRTGVTILVNHGVLDNTAFLDTELMNVSVQGQASPEMRNLVRAQVHFRHGMQLEKELNQKVQEEFERRAATGVLEGMNLKLLNTEKAVFKSWLKAEATSKFEEDIAREVENVMATLKTTVSKTKILTERYEFLKDVTLSEHIYKEILKPTVDPDLLEIKELISGMQCLKDLPTARLERCFAEHVDLASYRLDAWFYSLVLERLHQQRRGGEQRTTGIYLGAFSWLEDLRPGSFKGIHYREVSIQPDEILVPGFKDIIVEGVDIPGKITPVKPWLFRESLKGKIRVTDETTGGSASTASMDNPGNSNDATVENLMVTGGKRLSIKEGISTVIVDNPLIMEVPILDNLGPQYIYLGTDTVGNITYDPVKDKFIHSPRADPGNMGYIHAPSINHATTAAILRAGYETHKINTGSAGDTMAVNLSSDRVRRALFFLEGLKNGQELGALLGYQFERGLHDRDIGLDAFILEIRLKFPLVAGRVTGSNGVTSIDTAEAYNVVNGLALVENSRSPVTDYPYGVTGLPNTGEAKSAIISEVTQLHNTLDAINDLMMSEAMYQIVQGNFTRANGALNAMSGQSVVVDPEVINTPRNYHVISQRMGIQFDLSANGHKLWTPQGTPRSVAEPHLNRWLAAMLPDKENLLVNYRYRFLAFDGTPGSVYEDRLTLGDISIEPIDLYYILSQPSEQGEAIELVDRIGYHIRKEVLAADNVTIEIAFTDRSGFSPVQVSLFELQSLIDRLKEVLGSSRALDPKDFLLPTGAEELIAANPAKGVDTSLMLARLNDVAGLTMSNGKSGLEGTIADLSSEMTNIRNIISTTGIYEPGGELLTPIRNALINAANFGAQNAMPKKALETTEATAEELLALSDRVLAELQPRHGEAVRLLGEVSTAVSEDQKVPLLSQAAQNLFGRPFRVYPEYRLYNEGSLDAAFGYDDYLAFAGPHAKEEWLQGLSPVRSHIRAFHQAGLLSQALKGTDSHLSLSLAQLPMEPLDSNGDVAMRWLGMKFPPDYDIPDDNIAFVFQTHEGYSVIGLQAGIMLDSWVEEIPEKTAHTGVAVHYNNPNSEPPQTCLLAVSPDLNGSWSWDDLMDTLSETLEWAKKRAVDPDQLNKTFYAQVLPAIYAPVSGSEDTPNLDFGRNIIEKPKPGIFDLIKLKDFKKFNIEFQNPE